jgi:putative flavoprotein involved in K+ transport
MASIDTVIVGAGHAGLAVSRLLADAGRDHVVLDRGRVAERWRTERWNSLHLLTPNWMTRLPGWCYTGPDPDGYLSSAELIQHLERYAASFHAPVIPHTNVVEIAAIHGRACARFRVVTDTDTWHARHVVVATGPPSEARLPAGLSGLSGVSGRLEVVTANSYRNPSALPSGGVLVVGASASGVQIADELSRAGREVSLAVGRHTRMPRRYRGMDSFWWLTATGRLARTIDDVHDVAAARRENSLHLVGNPDPCLRGRDLDLGVLQARGVRLVGRLEEVVGTVASFSSDLDDTVGDADLRMHRFLDAVDRYVDDAGLTREVLPPTRPSPVKVSDPVSRLDLAVANIGPVLVAAGYRPYHPWLRLPVLAPDGSIRQRRGVTSVPGLYVVGQPFQHRRDSSFIGGARHDARYVVDHLLGREISVPPAAAKRGLAA